MACDYIARWMLGKRAYVYRNLHRDCYSVMVGGKVIAHVTHIELSDVEFRVRPGGLARARNSGKRNVHAFAVGIIVETIPGVDRPMSTEEWLKGAPVSYHFRQGHFFHAKTGDAIRKAETLHLSSNGLRAYQAS
jgi:hypothetical protein